MMATFYLHLGKTSNYIIKFQDLGYHYQKHVSNVHAAKISTLNWGSCILTVITLPRNPLNPTGRKCYSVFSGETLKKKLKNYK